MTQQASSKLSLQLILILGAIAALTPFAIDMYLPAMPDIAKDFLVSPGAVQVTLTAYTAGFAFGQLIHGPLADSYGRRPMLIMGTVSFLVLTILGALSTNITELTIVRVAQGFAGAAAAVIIGALVRDMFEREEFSRTMSFVTLVMTIAPLIAPVLGGHLSVWFGWRAVFWALAIFAVIVLVSILFKIKETLPKEKRMPFHVSSIIKNYKRLLSNPAAFGLICCSGFSFAGMFTFLTAGSFVYIDIYGISVENFGYYFCLNILCMILFTSINGRFVKRKGTHWMLRFGLIIQLTAGVLLFIGMLVGSWLTVHGGYKWVFIGMAILTSGLLCWCLMQLPETKPAHTQRGSLLFVAIKMLKDLHVWYIVLMVAIFNIALFSYYSLAPFMFEKLNVSIKLFGYTSAVLALGSIFGAMFNMRLLRQQIIPQTIITLASIILLISSSSVYLLQNSIWFFLPMIFVSLSFGLALPNLLSTALNNYRDHLGSAGALLGLFYYLIIGAGLHKAAIVGNLGITLIVCAILAITLTLFHRFYNAVHQ